MENEPNNFDYIMIFLYSKIFYSKLKNMLRRYYAFVHNKINNNKNKKFEKS